MTDEQIYKMYNDLLVRQNVLIDMMSNFIETYAKQNGLAVEHFEEEEVDYIDAT